MNRDICLHLAAGGYPSTWNVVAVYKAAYGIALNSARSWYDRHPHNKHIGSQFVVQIKAGEIIRSALFIDTEHFITRQFHDRPAMLIQWHGSPLPLSIEQEQLAEKALREQLTNAGFMIPYDQWAVDYPEDVEIAQKFKALMCPPASAD